MTGTTKADRERFEEELLRVYNKLAADSAMEAIKKKRVVSKEVTSSLSLA